MKKKREVHYAELTGKIHNIAKIVSSASQPKDYVISIYAHNPVDHYLALIMMQVLTLMKRTSLIVANPEEADVAVLMFQKSGDISQVMGRNPRIFLSTMYNQKQSEQFDFLLPWDRKLGDYSLVDPNQNGGEDVSAVAEKS
jgi:hypothetical protein